MEGDVGFEKVDGSISGSISDADLCRRFNEYVGRRLVVQEVAWHGGSGSTGPRQRYDVSVCVVDASAAAAVTGPVGSDGAADEAGEVGLLAS